MNRNQVATVKSLGRQGLIVSEGLLGTETPARSSLSGVKALGRAVVLEAVADYLLSSRKSLRFSDAEFYLFDSKDRSSPFAFLNACDFLGLDPNYLRSCFKRCRENDGVREYLCPYIRRNILATARIAFRRLAAAKQ